MIKKVDPPMAVAAAMPKASEWKTLPELFHVVDHPLFLAETGELLARGYDSKSKFFGNFRPLQSVNIDANLDDAKKAEAYIQKLFETLDLETDADRAAALCAVLTAVSRPALRTAPMFLVTAPVIGSGKGMFARLVSNFASAGEPPAKTLQGDEDEIKKELISALLTGAPVLFFDEVRGSEIDSPSLRTLSTSETLSGRLLGTNKDVNLSTRTLVFVTGNNVSPSADTARRMLEIRLNPRCENPATRKFKVDPIKFARENRSTLIRAALTIQAAYSNYLKAGGAEPDISGAGSFPEWNSWCRLPVCWLTGQDPAERLLAQLKSDPQKVELGEVLVEWQREFGDKAVTSGEVCKVQKLYDSIRAVASARNRDLSAGEVGRWLAKNKDRIVNGKKLEKSLSITSVAKWRVVSL